MPIMIISKHSHLGLEFDWLACDSFERCLYIATAGFGWIPENLDGPSYPTNVLAMVQSLPVRGNALIRAEQGNSTDWSDVARRGFFGLDWDHEREYYRIIAEPSVPILKCDLPIELMRLIGQASVDMLWKDGTIIKP